MTTTPADEIAAVEAALLIAVQLAATSERDDRDEPEAIAGRTAFAAIVSRLRALEAENARLRAFVEGISHMNAEAYTTVIEPDFTDLIPQAAALLAASESAKNAKNPPTDNG